jgi:lysozyme
MKRQPAAPYDGPTVPGIDVSKYQGVVDWAAVAASGIRYAIVRTGDGRDVDLTAVRNLTGAHKAGLLVGVYHYLRCVHGAAVNLGVIRDVLATARVPVGFVALDIEGAPRKGEREATGAWLRDVSTADVLAVVGQMTAALEADGHRVVIYSGVAWHWHIAQVVIYSGVAWHWHIAQKGLGQSFERLPLWTPFYSHRDRPSVPVYPDGAPVWEWRIWQHAGSKAVPGAVPGIAGNVDLNRFRGDEAELRRWWDPAHRETLPPPAFVRAEILAMAERAKGAGDYVAAHAIREAHLALRKG